MVFPIKEKYRISGYRFSSSHLGLDIGPEYSGKPGVKIYSPEKTTVVASGSIPSLEGQYLILKGKSHWYYFGHFASRKVKLNQTVKEGQVIGIMGMTGKATGIHTHHEVRKSRYGGQVDPEKFYKANVKKADMYKSKFNGKTFNLTAKGWFGKANHWLKQYKSKNATLQRVVKERNSARKARDAAKKNLVEATKKLNTLANNLDKIMEDDIQDELIKDELRSEITQVEKQLDLANRRLAETDDTNEKVNALYDYFYERWQTFKDFITRNKE
jgi:hypothetical protein